MQLSITRYLNEDLQVVDGFIEKDEWIDYLEGADFIAADSPRTGKNPLTGMEISIAPQPDIGWLVFGEERIALQYNDGDIWTECEPSTQARAAIARVANDLEATIIDQDRQVVKWS